MESHHKSHCVEQSFFAPLNYDYVPKNHRQLTRCSVTPKWRSQIAEPAAPLSRDPTRAERQRIELNSLKDDSVFVSQIYIHFPIQPAALSGSKPSMIPLMLVSRSTVTC